MLEVMKNKYIFLKYPFTHIILDIGVYNINNVHSTAILLLM